MRLVVDARTSSFAGFIDYAGVFPPAALSVADAVDGYRAARSSDAAWVAGRFLIRASQLEELASVATSTFRSGEAPWELSVVCDLEPADAASRATDFHSEMEPAMEVAAMEAPIRDPNDIDRLFTTLTSVHTEVVPYLEVTRSERIPPQIAAIREAVDTTRRPGGTKLRCGGITPDLFPTPTEVAQFIHAAVDAQLPFKATAGLHQPIRHEDSELGVLRHGFMNILMATAAAADGADMDMLESIIADTDEDAFSVSPAFARWRDLTIPGSTMRRIRQKRFVAYGSCDFDEPVDALVERNMLGVGT